MWLFCIFLFCVWKVRCIIKRYMWYFLYQYLYQVSSRDLLQSPYSVQILVYLRQMNHMKRRSHNLCTIEWQIFKRSKFFHCDGGTRSRYSVFILIHLRGKCPSQCPNQGQAIYGYREYEEVWLCIKMRISSNQKCTLYVLDGLPLSH